MKRSGQRWRAVLTAGRTSLWPIPVASVLLAAVAGALLPRADRALDSGASGWVSLLLFSGGPGAARTVLDAISSSLMTVTSLTFSLTVVTLQLASSQFSPRLLRTFTRDRFVHATLGVFLATFTYALTVMRTVRSADEEGSAFVPRFSVTTAFVLTVASVVMLVLFLAHLASEIRVESMLATVHEEARETARAVFGPEREGGGRPDAPEGDGLDPPPGANLLLASRSGFLVGVDEPELLQAALEAGACLVLDPLPGASVVAGTPLGRAWVHEDDATGRAGHGEGAGTLDDERFEQLQRRVQEAVMVGRERTESQDVSFGLQQLTDVAVKALSPGINDPTTAVHALGHSSALVCELARRHLGALALREPAGDGEDGSGDDDGDGDDDGGQPVRVVLQRPTLADLLETAVDGPRRYGAGDPTVLARLFQLLREVAWSARPAGAVAVEHQRRRLLATAEQQDFADADAERLAHLDEQVREAVAGRWRP